MVTDDKAERLTLGKLDISRRGNAFVVSASGGSLPIGMSLPDWRERFGLLFILMGGDANKLTHKQPNPNPIIQSIR